MTKRVATCPKRKRTLSLTPIRGLRKKTRTLGKKAAPEQKSSHKKGGRGSGPSRKKEKARFWGMSEKGKNDGTKKIMKFWGGN